MGFSTKQVRMRDMLKQWNQNAAHQETKWFMHKLKKS